MSIAPTDPDAANLSLADRAYLLLRDRLITLQIKPGEPIDDVQVARELGVGRTPVREALKRLEDDALVVAYPRRGTFATTVDITDLAHINEIRLQLEPLAARRAAERATPSQRAEIQELIVRLQSLDGLPTDRTELMRLDLAVHRGFYRAAGNPHLENVLIRYHNLATRIFCLFLDRLPTVAAHVGEHGPLLRAIAAGDGEKAAHLAHDHVTGFEAAVRTII